MIKTGIDAGVQQISDLIKYLQITQEQVGDVKVCVNEQFVYSFKDSIQIDKENNCIDFNENI